MKRIVFLAALFFIMLGTSVVSAQTEADNFYRSSSVNRQEMSFDNQYKNAHSREFSEDAYRLAVEPKELYIVSGAGHVDFYDRAGLIPFDKLDAFFKEYLK